MNETFALINMSENEEALERFIWLHENGVAEGIATDPSRLTFGLMYWVDFGNKYPPAIDALEKIRDAKTSSILNEVDSCDLFQEVEAINSHLSEDAKTINLFKQLDKNQPHYARQCWVYFKELAINSKLEYFIDKYIANIQIEYDKAEQRFISIMKHLTKSADDNTRLISVTRERFAVEASKLLQMAKDSNNANAIRHIQSKYHYTSSQYGPLNALN